jgi:hypothetical protein
MCLRRIAPAAAMVDDFEQKKNTNKTQLLAIILTVAGEKKISNLETRQGPSAHVLGATSPDPNPYGTSQVEDISYILGYQT